MFRCLVLVAAGSLAACAPTISAPSSPGQVPVQSAPVDTPTPAPVIVTPDPLPSTGSVVGDAAVRAHVALDRAWTAYVAIRSTVDLVQPFLTPTRAANIAVLERTIEGCFAKARLATSLADQAAQLELAVRAAAQLDAAVTDPD